LSTEKAELCKAHASHGIATVFEGKHIGTPRADLEVFALDLTLESCCYFLLIDLRFTLGQPVRDAVKEFGWEDGFIVLRGENIRAKSGRPSIVVYECQLENACDALCAD
jgi:hypothetical protein